MIKHEEPRKCQHSSENEVETSCGSIQDEMILQRHLMLKSSVSVFVLLSPNSLLPRHNQFSGQVLVSLQECIFSVFHCTLSQQPHSTEAAPVPCSKARRTASPVRDGFSPYLPREPPPSLPGPAQSPGSSSSSARVWTGSTAACLPAAPRCPTGTGTATPPNAHYGRTAR